MPVEAGSTTLASSSISAAGLRLPAARPDDSWTGQPDQRRVALERLGDRIAELSARIQAATYELLVLIRQFDERNGWASCASCAHWLSWRTGLAPGAAREHVRVARALADLPKLSDAMRRGVVSYSKVRAVTRVAAPETEQALLDVALCGTSAHVEQIVRGWRRVDRVAEQAEDRRRHETRSLRTWVDDDGMVVVRGRLTPEVAAVLRRALEAPCDQARGQAAGGSDSGAGTAADEAAGQLAPSFEQRQADAIGVVAQRALAGGLDRGTAGDRYQVVVHVDADALAEESDIPAGTSAGAVSGSKRVGGCPRVPTGTYRREAGDQVQATALPGACTEGPAGAVRRGDDARRARRTSAPCPGSPPAAAAAAASQTVLDEAGGIHIWPETARRMACDAATIEMQHGPGREILNVGRKTRTISPALRRALAARDRKCRFPGCQNRRCDAHHLEHWADGGATALNNLVLLCRRHHRAVHEEGFSVTLDAQGNVQFARPDRRPLLVAPPARVWRGVPLGPVMERLTQEDIAIGPHTATPAWRGERLDVGWAVGALWRPRPATVSVCSAE